MFMANRWLRVMFVAVLVVVASGLHEGTAAAGLHVERNACRSRCQR